MGCTMNINQWWPLVRPSTRTWLIAHNGEPLPAAIVADIAWNGAPVNAAQSWIDRSGPEGFSLSDAAVDWIEATANGENPQ
jgi:hypothetical protein